MIPKVRRGREVDGSVSAWSQGKQSGAERAEHDLHHVNPHKQSTLDRKTMHCSGESKDPEVCVTKIMAPAAATICDHIVLVTE